MKYRKICKVIAGLCITALLVANSSLKVSASAADGGSQPRDQVDFISRSDGFTVIDDNDLFSNMKEMMPGQTMSNTIALKNGSDQAVTFYLAARADYDSTPAGRLVTDTKKHWMEDLIRKIELTITRGSVVIYRGPASGDPSDAGTPGYEGDKVQGTMVDGVYGINLGYVPANEAIYLTATIEIPGEALDNSYQDSFACVKWIFCVEGSDPVNPVPTTDPGDSGPGRPGTDEPVSAATPGPSIPAVTPLPDEIIHGDQNPESGIEIIEPDDVPLSHPDVVIEIDKDGVPLAKTGGRVLYFKQAGIILLVMLAGLTALEIVRKKTKKAE